jgi:small subunit ribosomal protein S6
MRPYEVMVIFDADLEDSEIRAALDRHTKLLTSKGATLGTVDVWGKRRFAYRLQHRWEGYYVVFQARAEPAAVEELGRTLALADEVIRHKVLRIPESVYGQTTPQSPSAAAPASAEPASPAPAADAEASTEVSSDEAAVATDDAPPPDATDTDAPAPAAT